MVVKLVHGQEAKGAKVEREDRGDRCLELGTYVEHGAVTTQNYNKVNRLDTRQDVICRW